MTRKYVRTLFKMEADSETSLDSLRARLPRRLTAYKPSLHRYILHGSNGLPPRRVKLLRARGRQRSCVACTEEGWGRVLLRLWADWLVSLLSSSVVCSFGNADLINNRYLTFHLLLKDSIVELPLGDTSRYFAKAKRA